MKNLAVKTLAISAALLPCMVYAHAGHDHQSSWSNLVHFLWLAPIIVAAGLLFITRKKAASKK